MITFLPAELTEAINPVHQMLRNICQKPVTAMALTLSYPPKTRHSYASGTSTKTQIIPLIITKTIRLNRKARYW